MGHEVVCLSEPNTYVAADPTYVAADPTYVAADPTYPTYVAADF